MTEKNNILSFDTVKQYNKEQIDHLNSFDWWTDREPKDIAIIQSFQKVLICDFAVFKKSLEIVFDELLTDSAFTNPQFLHKTIQQKYPDLTPDKIENLLVV